MPNRQLSQVGGHGSSGCRATRSWMKIPFGQLHAPSRLQWQFAKGRNSTGPSIWRRSCTTRWSQQRRLQFPNFAGQYLTKLICDQMGTAQVERVKFIKLEPRASTSHSEEPVLLNKSSYLASRLLELAEVMKTPDESAIQVEVLQKANA